MNIHPREVKVKQRKKKTVLKTVLKVEKRKQKTENTFRNRNSETGETSLTVSAKFSTMKDEARFLHEMNLK